MRISDWSSDVCSSDLRGLVEPCALEGAARVAAGLLEPLAPAFERRSMVQQRIAQQFIGMLATTAGQARAAHRHDVAPHDVVGAAAWPDTVAETHRGIQFMEIGRAHV